MHNPERPADDLWATQELAVYSRGRLAGDPWASIANSCVTHGQRTGQ